MKNMFYIIFLSIAASSSQATEVLIACEYDQKVFMSIVDTDKTGIQRVFGHNAYVKQHNKGFLRVSIQMEAETRDIIFSGRSGAMSYNSGVIDQRVKCRQEALLPDAIKKRKQEFVAESEEEQKEFLWYFDKDGRITSYVTKKPY